MDAAHAESPGGSVQYTSNLTVQCWLLEGGKEKQTNPNKLNTGL